MKEFLRFGIVGTFGFVIDASTLLTLVALGCPPFIARVCSFVIAATFTFTLNRRFTFRIGGQPRLSEWSLYLTLNALGAFINLGIFSAWISQMGTKPLQLLAGTAVGSVTAWFFNYALSRLLVFDRPVRKSD